MKSPRLIPVVMCAAFALLVFKGVGLVTHGGYILGGTSLALAAEQGGASATPPGGPTMTDTNPTLKDTDPTLPDKSAHEAASSSQDPGTSEAGQRKTATRAAKPESAALAVDCAMAAGAGEKTDPDPGAAKNSVAALVETDCGTSGGDAVPMKVDPSGKLVPMAGANGQSLTRQAVLDSLGARRSQLDERAKELAMRAALVEAAEKQMQVRADALKALQTKIDALLDQRKAIGDKQFAAIVSMYESMKPRDAAKIFDGLDMEVLERVAKAMNPRKMAPIMAAMTSSRAQQLTTQLASADVPSAPPPAPASSSDALPQIVGH